MRVTAHTAITHQPQPHRSRLNPHKTHNVNDSSHRTSPYCVYRETSHKIEDARDPYSILIVQRSRRELVTATNSAAQVPGAQLVQSQASCAHSQA